MSDVLISFLDVGQGDGTVIRLPNGEIVIVDMGSTMGTPQTRPAIIEYFKDVLKFQNGGKVRALFLTHPDADHYNLVEALRSAFNMDIQHVYYSGAQEEYQSTSSLWCNGNKQHQLPYRNMFLHNHMSGSTPCAKSGCSANVIFTPSDYLPSNFDTWLDNMIKKNKATALGPGAGLDKLIQTNGAEIQLMAASCPGSEPSNAGSIVLRVYFANKSAILMADATRDTEDAILNAYKANNLTYLLKCDVLKLGHHGSARTSTTQEWAEATDPSFLFLSADRHGNHGFVTKKSTGYHLPSQAAIDTMLQYSPQLRKKQILEHSYVSHYEKAYFEVSRDIASFNKKPTQTQGLFNYTFTKADAANVEGHFYEVRTKNAVYTSLVRLDTGSALEDVGVRFDVTFLGAKQDPDILLNASSTKLNDLKHFGNGYYFIPK